MPADENGGASSLEEQKPMLSTGELIAHLKEKGVKFEYDTESDAHSFLERNNNYFKLTAYRKNFDTYAFGENRGKYIHLDFAALRELSILDMRLRYLLVHMCLDIEHAIKVDLIYQVQEHNKKDAYQIIRDFIASKQEWRYGDPDGRDYLNTIEKGAEKDVYRRGLIQKYHDDYPIWAFAEILHFSELISLYMFVKCRYCCQNCPDLGNEKRNNTCARIQNGEITQYRAFMQANHRKGEIHLCQRLREIEWIDRLLRDVRHLRNAAAHNSCFLNDLRIPKGSGSEDMASPLVNHLFRETNWIGLNESSVNRIMKNPRLRQLYATLCAHRYFVKSEKTRNHRWSELRSFTDERLMRNEQYFAKCGNIMNVFDYLRKVVDKWGAFC